jgi:hypothetical protein
MALKDMTGSVFGALTVTERESNLPDGTAVWRCVCECGEVRVIPGNSLRAGRNKSCGCLSPRFTSERMSTHGMSRSRIYKIWLGMIARCSESSSGKTRRLYYEKGIRVCERWMSFESFLEDMGVPMSHQSIDRKDGNKGYDPENCRWADRKTQANNTSSNLIITLNGISMTASEWSDETGIKANTIVYRVRRGWSPERTLEKNPVNARAKTKMDRARPCDVCGKTFIPRPVQIRAGRGKFCSQKCNGESRKI